MNPEKSLPQSPDELKPPSKIPRKTVTDWEFPIADNDKDLSVSDPTIILKEGDYTEENPANYARELRDDEYEIVLGEDGPDEDLEIKNIGRDNTIIEKSIPLKTGEYQLENEKTRIDQVHPIEFMKEGEDYVVMDPTEYEKQKNTPTIRLEKSLTKFENISTAELESSIKNFRATVEALTEKANKAVLEKLNERNPKNKALLSKEDEKAKGDAFEKIIEISTELRRRQQRENAGYKEDKNTKPLPAPERYAKIAKQAKQNMLKELMSKYLKPDFTDESLSSADMDLMLDLYDEQKPSGLEKDEARRFNLLQIRKQYDNKLTVDEEKEFRKLFDKKMSLGG